MHGSHMNGLQRRAGQPNKKVIFLGGAVPAPFVEPALQELVHHQLGGRPACWKAGPAFPFGFVL